MVERVARALCYWQGGQPDRRVLADRSPQVTALGNCVVSKVVAEWRLYEGTATIAIKAMREPTDAMMSAGDALIEQETDGRASRVWEAMVDAALGAGRAR
jgi:hypothetical protein